MSAEVSEISEVDEFRRLISEMHSGSPDAAWKLVELYGPHVRAVVRRKLDSRMRSIFDSDDFVQGVWASLLRIQHKLIDIDDPRRFIALLSAIARNKVIDEVRRTKQTAKRDLSRQQSLDDSHMPAEAEADRRQPTPSQLAIARERWEKMVSQQSERHRKVLELRMAGATYLEIGKQLRMNERTARRVVERLIERQAG